MALDPGGDDSERSVPAPRSPGQRPPPTFLDYSLRTIVPGLVAAVLVAIGAIGVGWLPLDTVINDSAIVRALRTTTSGALISKLSVIAGIVLLAQAWLLLGFDVLRKRVPDIRFLWATLAVWSMPLILTPPLFSRDVYSYFAQGKLMVEGVNPYTHGSASVPGWFSDGVDPLWAESPTPYGQFWLLLAKGAAAFTGPHPYSGALLLRLLAVVGVVLLAWSIPRIARSCGIDPRAALWLGVLNPLVLMHFVSGAHNDALMIGLIAAGFAVTLDRLPWLGVVLVALAGAVKPIGLVALPFVILLGCVPIASMVAIWRRWLIGGAIAAALFVVFAAITSTGFGWLAALSTPGEVRTWLSPPTAVGMLTGGLAGLLGFDVTDATVTISRLIGTAATVVILVWLCVKPFGKNPIRSAAIALLVVVALGPVVQPWYLLWSLPLFAAVGLSRIELRVAIVGTVGFTLFGLLTSSATQDALIQISDLVAAAVVVVLLVVLAWSSRRERTLLLGGQGVGLEPETELAKARSTSLVLRAPS